MGQDNKVEATKYVRPRSRGGKQWHSEESVRTSSGQNMVHC